MKAVYFRVFSGKLSELAAILQETGAKLRVEGESHILTWEGESETRLRLFEARWHEGRNVEVSPTRLNVPIKKGKEFARAVKTFSQHFQKEEVSEASASFRLRSNIYIVDGAITLVAA